MSAATLERPTDRMTYAERLEALLAVDGPVRWGDQRALALEAERRYTV